MPDTPAKQTLADALGRLVGCELASVTFVRDYVQLGFDGPGMNAYTMPTVTCGAESLTTEQPGYRDSLCGQIGSRVKSAEVDEQQVSIIFESGAVVSISIRDDDYRGPEALEFSLDQKDRIWVV
jgi:hypothetical protein